MVASAGGNSSAASAASAAATSSGDSDMSGRVGDPGDGYVPRSAATAASAGACAGAR
jgi:hypothetical protein